MCMIPIQFISIFTGGRGLLPAGSHLMPMTLMIKCARFFLLLAVIACGGKTYGNSCPRTNRHPVTDVAQGTEIRYIFANGENGYSCFRIPAIVMTGSGTLLAFAEGRKHGCSDTGDIDLVLKRSLDDGKTWGPLQVVWNDGENTCGNPAPVVDRQTGRIHLLTTWNLGSDHEREIIQGTSEDTRRIFVTSSDDDGETWRSMREITKKVKRKDWTWYATGPCSGIQLSGAVKRGRLVIPCDHVEAGTKTGYSHVIYSDNHGKTWKLGGISPLAQTNESTVAELSSGALMLNMRNHNRAERYRKVTISDDGGKSWGRSYQDTALAEPICQASLIRHTFPDGKSFLVFSNPDSKTQRANMCIKLSPDDGRSWPIARVIHEGPAAYSGLVSFANGDIGILYEGGYKKPYEGIAFEIIAAEDFFDGNKK